MQARQNELAKLMELMKSYSQLQQYEEIRKQYWSNYRRFGIEGKAELCEVPESDMMNWINSLLPKQSSKRYHLPLLNLDYDFIKPEGKVVFTDGIEFSAKEIETIIDKSEIKLMYELKTKFGGGRFYEVSEADNKYIDEVLIPKRAGEFKPIKPTPIPEIRKEKPIIRKEVRKAPILEQNKLF